MNLSKIKITNKGLYWGLIIAFAILYLFVGFVSTLHSITFFHLANTMSLAILLGITYELGQAGVLFGILMTKNKDKFLPWALMFLLTALQVTANVYASLKYMMASGSNDWIYWQKSILFGVQASSPEMYQVIISWISGALLPIVALGMTALVATNIKLMTEEIEVEKPEDSGELKKAKEFLPTEEVEIPKRKRNPLLKKSKIKRLNLKALNKPSVGDQIIASIEKNQKQKEKVSYNSDIKDDEISSNNTQEPINNKIPYLQNGVEVIDAKAISKDEL